MNRLFKKSTMHRSTSDKIFDTIIFIILTIIFLIVAYPLYFIIISSFSSPTAVSDGSVVLYPIGFSLDGYITVFKEEGVLRGFSNSLIYAVAGTLVSIAVTLPTAYALSRNDFYGRKAITIFYLITMFVSGGLIPSYLVVQRLRMIDTIWALIIPGAISVYNVVIARTFFKTTIPAELFEAAKLDGCGNTRFFFNVVMPLSGAITAILVLYCAVGMWNSYFGALLYVTTPRKYPLQLVLRTILIQNSQSINKVYNNLSMEEIQRKQRAAELMKYSLIIISSLPVLVLYPFIQKHFVKGVMIGSLKG